MLSIYPSQTFSAAFRNLVAVTFVVIATAIPTALAIAQPYVFTSEQKFTDSATAYQLSRNPGRSAQYDAAGNLHVVYWSGALVSNPVTTSGVYYRRYQAGSGWSSQELVDDSFVGPQRIGGRHPAMILEPNGSVFVTWHDGRHCTALGSYIDNLEIYADRKAPLGNFSNVDTRITSSSASHMGDNGYMPRATRTSDGRITIAWYDFNAGTGSVSDIYSVRTDTLGNFAAPPPLAAMQRTDATTRGGTPSYSFVDVDSDSSGTRHFVWTTGFVAGGDLYYATMNAADVLSAPTLVATGAGDPFDPPKIRVAPNGDIWIIAARENSGGDEKIAVWRKSAASVAFDTVRLIVPSAGRQTFPDFQFEESDKIRLVWVDERSGRHVYTANYALAASFINAEQRATSNSDQWFRPSVARRTTGDFAVVVERNLGPTDSDLFFLLANQPNAATFPWHAYE